MNAAAENFLLRPLEAEDRSSRGGRRVELYSFTEKHAPREGEVAMKYVLLGSIDTAWVGRHAERTRLAKAKLQDLGITLDAVYYTQGPYDFVDVIDSPDPEAALAFSVWYANQGYGRIQTLPAFDLDVMERATQRA
jgi:uncharacterized protein with GYD domain